MNSTFRLATQVLSRPTTRTAFSGGLNGRLASRLSKRPLSSSCLASSPLHSTIPRQISQPQRWRISSRTWQSSMRNLRTKRYNSNSSGPSPNPTPELGSPQPGLKDQLKRLFREYGWAAVGVYLLLSAADLPICLLIVRAVGTERVGAAEHAVLEKIQGVWRSINPLAETEAEEQMADAAEGVKAPVIREGKEVAANTVVKDGDASLWTQFALAYAIHKSIFIFVRIPLTVAFTPKIVKTLRGWGWQIGKRPMRPNKPS